MSWLLWGGKSYAKKVLSIQPGNLIAYWPLWEAVGPTADNIEGTAARDGDYVGVTLGQPGIGDGRTCPLFDGINDVVDIYSASLNAVWDGGLFTINMWFKVLNAGVWSDGNSNTAITIEVDGNNYVWILEAGGVDNRIQFLYRAGGVTKSVNENNVGPRTDFFSFGITVDAGADEMKCYYEGVQVGGTQNGLGVWAGNLTDGKCAIGSHRVPPDFVQEGYLAHAALWDVALSAPEMAILGVL